MQKSKVIVKNKTRVNSQTQGTFWGDKGGRCPDNRVICKNYQRKIEIVKSWKMQNQFCQFDDGGWVGRFGPPTPHHQIGQGSWGDRGVSLDNTSVEVQWG